MSVLAYKNNEILVYILPSTWSSDLFVVLEEREINDYLLVVPIFTFLSGTFCFNFASMACI